MSHSSENSLATLILKLLLDQTCAWPDGEGVKWDALLRIAKRNVVLIRVAERLEKSGLQPPEFFKVAAEEERHCAATKIELVRKISRACSVNGIGFIFAKAFQHYPDMGRDLDLYVLTRSTQVDRFIVEKCGAAPLRRGLSQKIAGATSYRINGYAAPLDIHHGRMGHLGEHNSYLDVLMINSRKVDIEGTAFLVPSAEDQLLVQGIQRVYGRRYIRLSDIVCTIRLIRQDGLDWNYIVTNANRLGIFHGLCCYLSYVAQIHNELCGRDPLPSWLRSRLILDGWGRVEFKDWCYRFANVRVAGRVYMRKFHAAVVSGDWDCASRLCVFPLVAATTIFKRVGAS